MKKISLIILTLQIVKIASAQIQSSIEMNLRNFPIANYLNKPIDTLLTHLPPGYDTAFIIGPASTINKGATLQIDYSNYPGYPFAMHIYIYDAQFITVNRDFRLMPLAKDAWPLALLRKEKIACIKIYTVNYETLNEGCIY
jgi:hypothetical protein